MLDDFEKEKLIAVLLKDPNSIYKEYHEKLYSEWRHEVRKVAQEATVNMKDMAMYLYINKYYSSPAENLVTGMNAPEFIRRFLNEQGVDV
jgi:hypothetical protein